MYSLRASNGHLNWTFHASGAVKGGLAYSAGQLYFGDYASRVYALAPPTATRAGPRAWRPGRSTARRPWPSAGCSSATPTTTSTPCRSPLGRWCGSAATECLRVRLARPRPTSAGLGPTVFIGSYDGNFYALNADSGAVRWSHASGSPISGSGTVIGDVVYYGVLGVKNSIGLNVRTGRQVFSYPRRRVRVGRGRSPRDLPDRLLDDLPDGPEPEVARPASTITRWGYGGVRSWSVPWRPSG